MNIQEVGVDDVACGVAGLWTRPVNLGQEARCVAVGNLDAAESTLGDMDTWPEDGELICYVGLLKYPNRTSFVREREPEAGVMALSPL